MIPDSLSRDMIGKSHDCSLDAYFSLQFGHEEGPQYGQARDNFIRSMAAYSCISYLLAFRDRHNGNIMISNKGHIIHIDFGFILDLAPKNIRFENSPFKFTSEMLKVMGGRDGPFFAWFKALFVRAFLLLRAHYDTFVNLLTPMSGSEIPCFKNRELLFKRLRERFRLDLDDGDAAEFAETLVMTSCENVRTILYDSFQLQTNGIPY